MDLDRYKIVVYRNQPEGWIAEIPSLPGCCALMATRLEAMLELEAVFAAFRSLYAEQSRPLPVDTTEVTQAFPETAWRLTEGVSLVELMTSLVSELLAVYRPWQGCPKGLDVFAQ